MKSGGAKWSLRHHSVATRIGICATGMQQSADEPVAERRLHDREEEQRADRRPGLEREDERVGPDHRRVEREPGEADAGLQPAATRAAGRAQKKTIAPTARTPVTTQAAVS